MVMNTRPIGIFDSGVGGLSILRELQKQLPGENYVFLADQAHVPYGEKTPAQLRTLAVRITKFLLTYDIKLLVIACNTATCYAINTLRNRFDLPIVGTVPAVKPAAQYSRSKTVAVIGTPATIKSDALTMLIETHARGVRVVRIGCKGLEDTVETGLLDGARADTLLNHYLSRVPRSADLLVLGCTHYPFLKNRIRRSLGRRIRLIDSGSAIARRSKSVLIASGTANTRGRAGLTRYFTTGSPENFASVASKLLKKPVRALRADI